MNEMNTAAATNAEQGMDAMIPPDFPTVELPPELGNVQFTISTQRNRKDRYCRETTISLQGFVDELSKPVIKPETHAQYLAMNKEDQTNSKDVGGFVLGTLKGNRRNKNTVEKLCGVALDADYAQAGMIDLIRYTMPYVMIIYSTRKHTPEKPRYRILIMLSHPVTPEQHSAISRKLAEHIGIEMFDKSTFEPNRMMFFPSISSDSQYVFEVLGRELCDPDAILAEYEDWHDSSKWPMCPEEKRLISGTVGAKQKDPMSKDGVIGAYNKTHSITRVLEEFGTDRYEPASVPGRWSYKAADSTAGVVVYEDKFFYSFHASDPLSYQLMNAFDLTRALQFLDQDENARESTPTHKLPSYKSMLAFAREDGEVKEMLAEQKAQRARLTFAPLDDDDSDGSGGSGATPTDSSGDGGVTPTDGNGAGGAGDAGGVPADSGSTTGDDATGDDGKHSKAKNKPDTRWRRRLEYDNMGNLKGSMLNAMLIFHNDQNLAGIVYNELSDSLEIQGAAPWDHPSEIWRDQDDSQLIAYLELNYGSFSERIYRNALAKIADDRRYHPIRDYFAALPPWDGVPRVDRLLVTTLGAEDTEYVHAVTRKSLVAAIARIMEPGVKFDTILVLIGPQGTGKSTLIAKLAMKWFNDSFMLSDTKDKTAAEKLQGSWILEIGELAGMRKADQEILKGFLSRQNDIFRPAFGRRTTPHLRQCVFMATTNSESGFLRDTTGNRRFWPVTVPGFNEGMLEEGAKPSWLMTQDDVDQIWAEALTYYKARESLVLPAKLKEEAVRFQRESMETDDRESLVREYLEKLLPENWYNLELSVRINYLNGGEFAGAKLTGTMRREKVCNQEIWTECFGNSSSRIGRADSNAIIAMLERIPGWVRSPKKARVKPYGVVNVYVRDPDYKGDSDDGGDSEG